MGVPDPRRPPVPSALDRVVDDQALAVLAAIDDLRHDLPGSVHDARVALRKLRSTLVVFRPLLDKEAASRIEEGLRWFAGELSGARDAQVVRSRITTAIHSHPGGEENAEDLLTELDESAAEAWDRARAALTDPRLDELMAALQQARLRSVATASEPDTMRRRLGGNLNELIAKAQATVQDATAEDVRLHRLRKRVKRVRFAVASLRDSTVEALPVGSGAGRVAHALEELQDLLGEYQDAVVTAGILDRIGSQAPRLAGVAGELARSQRAAAATVREALPGGVDRVRRAAHRLQERLAKQRDASP
jgi:CHAD domain-containing protein